MENLKAGLQTALRVRLASASFRRILRYGCVGTAVSLFYSMAVIAGMHGLRPITPTEASVLAFLLTLPVGYLAHRRITFGNRSHDALQPVRFACTTMTSFAAAVGGMYVITVIAERSYLLGIAWNWLIIPALNYAIYLLWVFRDQQSERSTHA